MAINRLEEDFRKMGLSDNEVRESLTNLLGKNEEADIEDDSTEDFEEAEDSYLGDVVDEGMKAAKMHRTKSGAKAKSKRYYASHKSQIKKQRIKRAKSSVGKRVKKLLAMKPQKKGYRRQFMSMDDAYDSRSSVQESLIESINDLARSIDHDPSGRFNEYVTAFNHIADLGELGAMRVMDEDEDAACDVINIALEAEDVLKAMEEMDGSLTIEEDEILEALLADLMEDVASTFESYDLFEGCKNRSRKGSDEEEGDDEGDDMGDEEVDDEEEVEEDIDEDVEDNEMEEDDISEATSALIDAVRSLREAKGPKKVVKTAKSKKRLAMVNGKIKAVTTPSKWGKMNKEPGAAKKQINLRKDVRNKEALLGYLRAVKSGKVAPGQPLSVSKSGKKLNKGARAAMKAAGKK